MLSIDIVVPSNVNAAELISYVPFLVRSNSAFPALIATPTPSIVIASEASISKVEESISIGLLAVVPIAMLVAESIVNAPLASISNVFQIKTTDTEEKSYD